MRKAKNILIFFGVVLFLVVPEFISAQDSTAVELKTPDLGFLVKRLSSGGYLFSTRVTWYENKIDNPVPGCQVDMIVGDEPETQIKLSATTDAEGYADVLTAPELKLPRTKEGLIHATAAFSGTKTVESAFAEVSFTEVKLIMNLELVDSVKTVNLKAFKIDGKGIETPLEGESVKISVQRMLSKLPIGDITIDAEGNGSLEFPADLPGEDSLGTLEIIASISESETYGNIEAIQKINWGKPKPVWAAANRTLWSHIAPVWMIISLSILLTGVWAHYLYVIIQLIRIKRKGIPEKIES